jgi:photosystem II stability/assembly factor-like uncharacterized protein
VAAAPKLMFDVAMSADGMRAIVTYMDKQDTKLAYSADGGATWTEQLIADRLQEVGLSANGLIGYAVGIGGVLLQTSDGGATWRRQLLEPKISLRHVAVSANGQRVAVIASGDRDQLLQLSEDGGMTWRVVPIPMREWSFITGVALSADGTTGLILGVGQRGAMWRSADGGRTWQPLALETQAAWWIYGAAALAVVMLGMAFWPRRA